MNRLTNRNLQMAEAATLVESLPGWRVAEKIIKPYDRMNSRRLFGKGNLAEIGERIRACPRATAVFVSHNMLRSDQLDTLQSLWGLPVYDRFTVVLQIFKQRARTREAKLQVSLAELFYLRRRISGVVTGRLGRQGGVLASAGGMSRMKLDARQQLLQDREVQLKSLLSKLREGRQIRRQARDRLEIPVVAVVGYTNAGKTTLIKSLTGDDTLRPRDKLFATLDVTSYEGRLPSGLQVLYLDTVGFIQDIPTQLIASFTATLDDVRHADAILHVRDASHPDLVAQCATVQETLRSLDLPDDLLKATLEVDNKYDLLESGQEIPEVASVGSDVIETSALLGHGLADLEKWVEKVVMEATGRVTKVFRIPQGSVLLQKLYKIATVVEADADPQNVENLLVKVIITEAAYAKFMASMKS